MAFATVYYYNKNKFPVTIKGDDNENYYLAPRDFTFIKSALKSGFVLPPGVVTYATPGWFQQRHWPYHKPWLANPGS
jgi:hypothetical protein